MSAKKPIITWFALIENRLEAMELTAITPKTNSFISRWGAETLRKELNSKLQLHFYHTIRTNESSSTSNGASETIRKLQI